VRLFAVFPNSNETDQGVKSYCEQVEFPFPCVRDVSGYLAKRLGATMTPQAFLVDQDSVLRYRGAIDDHRYENRVAERYLVDALESVMSGNPIENQATKAMGCSLHLTAAAGEGEVTYTGHIARILQDKCQSCHRPEQVATLDSGQHRLSAVGLREVFPVRRPPAQGDGCRRSAISFCRSITIARVSRNEIAPRLASIFQNHRSPYVLDWES
jgi:hypothetical protein